MFNPLKILLALCLFIFTIVSNVSAQESPSIRQMPGVAVASKSAKLSANLPSQLLEILVTEGQRVKKGDLLATLDYREAKAAYDAAKALATDNSGVELARIDSDELGIKVSRVESAVATGASNSAELESVRNEFRRAMKRLKLEQNRLKQARHNKDVLRWKLESFLIRAPFDGLVTQIKASAGNQIAAGQPVVELVHYAELNVELNLPLQLFGKMTPGRKYRLIADSPVSREIGAELKFVSPIVSSASQTFMAKFEITNAEFELPSGFTVKLANDQLSQIAQSSDLKGVPAQASSYSGK